MKTEISSTQQVQLHTAQRDFLHSEVLYRAFCGGIGSGKSWAGSYDLIKRAKAGRLYMVIAPTYQMLSDSTLRSFLAVAGQIGVVNMGEVKKSAPPSLRLRTGAEVLFRSADEPSRLYGPNLSGIWLDEASLMPQDVFNVGIGRLREAGEQGWLTATFTPKGKTHWTFEVFNTGRPNTAIFFAKTSDNPFLPADFHKNVRAQYTSHLALQELEGQFVDVEGSLFKRAWFPTVAAAPTMVSRLGAWDLASTPKNERQSHDPDYTVGVLLGKDEAGIVYLLDVRRLRGSPQQVETAVRRTAESDGKRTAIWLEQEPGSSGVVLVDHYGRHVLSGYNFRAERSTGDKTTRAQPLAAAAERGLVKMVTAHWNKDFLDEVSIFPYGSHDDQVDACSLAFNKLAAKKKFWLRMDGITLGKPDAPTPVSEPTVEVSAAMGKIYTIPGDPCPGGIDIRPGAPGWRRLW
jgi:predicted phage terminase large subunit-like protein